jgi:hypothetical protein
MLDNKCSISMTRKINAIALVVFGGIFWLTAIWADRHAMPDTSAVGAATGIVCFITAMLVGLK